MKTSLNILVLFSLFLSAFATFPINTQILPKSEINTAASETVDWIPHSPNIQLAGHVGGSLRDLVLNDHYLFAITGNYLTIFDVQNPSQPIVLSKAGPLAGNPNEISLYGDRVYITSVKEGIHIFDISNLTSPLEVGSYIIATWPTHIMATNGLLYVTYSDMTLKVLDDTNLSRVVEVASLPIETASNYNISKLKLVGNFITFTTPSEFVVVTVTDPRNPQIVTRYAQSQTIRELAVLGNFAYLCGGNSGITILNISDPANPNFAGSISTTTSSYCLADHNNLFFENSSYIFMYDISNPSSPQLVGKFSRFSGMSRIFASFGNYYVASDRGGSLHIIQLTQPPTISHVGFYPTGGVLDIKIQDHYAFTVIEYFGIQIFDITNPTNPLNHGYFDSYYAGQGEPSNIWVDGNYAYLLKTEDPYYLGMSSITVIDISNVDQPIQVGFVEIHDSANLSDSNLQKIDHYLYVRGFRKTYIIDVADPANPKVIGVPLDISGGMSFLGNYLYVGGHPFSIFDVSNPATPSLVGSLDLNISAQNLAIEGGYAYLATLIGLRVIDISDPISPKIVWKSNGAASNSIIKNGSTIYSVLEDYGSYSFEVIDVTNPSKPLFNSYYGTDWDVYRTISSADGLLFLGGILVGIDILSVQGLQSPSTTSGYVVDDKNTPLLNVTVSVNNVDSGLGNSIFTTKTDVNGSFSFNTVLGINNIDIYDPLYTFNPNTIRISVPPNSTELKFVGIKTTVDLDVSTAQLKLSPYPNQIKEDQPNSTYLEAQVKNLGTINANNVKVDLLNSNSYEVITSTIIPTIPAGGESTVMFKWTVNSNSNINVIIRAETEPGKTDVNLTNNYSYTSSKLFTAFAPYKFNPDTFSFHNPSYGFSQEFLAYVNDSAKLSTWRLLIGPTIYALSANSGLCYGMSQTSILYWDEALPKPVNKPTYEMTWTEASTDIRNQHAAQTLNIISILGKGWFIPSVVQAQENPQRAYQDISNKLGVENPMPSILSGKLIWGTQLGGHSVVAYKVVEVGQEKYVFVYDSNWELPNNPEAEVLHLDISNNRLVYGQGVDKYFYSASAFNPIRDPALITSTMIGKVEQAVLQYLVSETKLGVFFSKITGSQNNQLQVASDSPDNFLITDTEGHRVGYINGTLVNEVVGAELSNLETGYYILLPADRTYTLVSDSTGQYDLSVAMPNPNSVLETDYLGFSIPTGSTASTEFGPTTKDWLIHISGQSNVMPTSQKSLKLNSVIYLPVIRR